MVRSRLRKVSNEAVKCTAFARAEKNAMVSPSVHRIHQISWWSRVTVESQDSQGLSDASPWSLSSRPWPADLGVSELFSWLLPSSVSGSGKLHRFGYWIGSPWFVVAGRSQQVTRAWWFAQESVLEDVAHVCAGYVQPLVCPGSHHQFRC